MDKDFLKFIKSEAQKWYKGESVKIYLFGSRARGDNSERSDWDLALCAKREDVNFMLNLKDSSPVLSGVDIVFYEDSTEDMKKNIKTEGMLIYEH